MGDGVWWTSSSDAQKASRAPRIVVRDCNKFIDNSSLKSMRFAQRPYTNRTRSVGTDVADGIFRRLPTDSVCADNKRTGSEMHELQEGSQSVVRSSVNPTHTLCSMVQESSNITNLRRIQRQTQEKRRHKRLDIRVAAV
eukprot:1577305-Pleurochrysis_carterae.AAC.2